MPFVGNDCIANLLAIDYNFLPPAKCHATGGSQIVKGKYETVGDIHGRRTMLLAHWYDHTNILCQFNFFIPFHVTRKLDPPEIGKIGELTPPATGNYESNELFNNSPTYVGPLRFCFIWWDGVDSWIINEQVGHTDGPYWKRTGLSIPGEYAPQNEAEGIAIVESGPL